MIEVKSFYWFFIINFKDYTLLQRDLNKVLIKRENIKNIQRILIRLLSENRENISHQDIYQLVDDFEDKDEDVKEKNYYLMHGKDKFHNDLHNSLITFKAQIHTLELESPYFIKVINYLQGKLS